jgi:hypothetical protein
MHEPASELPRKTLPRLSEKARGYLQRGLAGRRMGTFGPVSASVSRRNPCSECCSQPFSDSFSEAVWEVWSSEGISLL